MGWHLGASKDHPHPTESHGEDDNNYGCLFPVHVGCSPVMPEVAMPLGSAATRPKTRLLRPPALRFAFAQLMKVAAASTTIPVTNAAMQEYAKISLRTLAVVTPRAASPIRAATSRPIQHRGEKVKFFEPEPLNPRKNGGYVRHAHPQKAGGGSSARHSAAARCCFHPLITSGVFCAKPADALHQVQGPSVRMDSTGPR